jgi:hypothetical protein
MKIARELQMSGCAAVEIAPSSPAPRHTSSILSGRRVSLHAALNYVRATPIAQQATDATEITASVIDGNAAQTNYVAKERKRQPNRTSRSRSASCRYGAGALDIGDERIPPAGAAVAPYVSG